MTRLHHVDHISGVYYVVNVYSGSMAAVEPRRLDIGEPGRNGPDQQRQTVDSNHFDNLSSGNYLDLPIVAKSGNLDDIRFAQV
jgi:hypothetical protein